MFFTSKKSKRMIRLLFIVCLIPALRPLTVRAQDPEGIDIVYNCRFNIQFDQQRLIVPFHARLLSSAGNSSFHAVRDKSFELGDGIEYANMPDTLFQVLKSVSKSQMLFASQTMTGRTNYYQDTLHAIEWTLLDEGKRIDQLDCYKAKARFRGRDYIAWYAPAIPVPNGPWKLGGLPGMIIEAYDVQEDLYFLARSIRYLDSKDPALPVADLTAYPSFSEYVAYLRNTLDMIQASMATQGQGDCLDCQTKSKVKLHLWEKVLD
jgi:GLPGLI family protein